MCDSSFSLHLPGTTLYSIERLVSVKTALSADLCRYDYKKKDG